MFVLVLDSSTPAVTTALVAVTADGVDMRAARRTVDARAHGELLAPQVAEVLAEAGVRAADLTAIVAGLGPGPFTGLRVGLVTAASMGQALGIPTYGVCSLDAIGVPATEGVTAVGGGPVLAATDARRREIYWAVYDGTGARTVGPGVDTPAVVAERARELGVTAAAGDGALRYADQLGVPVGPEPRYPDPLALAALAADRVRAGAPGELLTPLYLRRPDAVAGAGARKSVLQ
ncbi:tRNA (adenosine(37)-N6)-threonylcarbamoyltransferase complex dimerization subunit type 1 TsaB [Melissospora conviva]|uniref:tRNA (adenosine(37)-N6)-threonylcarbamoyltransferase complex dimerization subunit type 1 TsaB n=1 Tax=Melissospora conviva TaxID=3388432 RepID=UPI003B78A112